MSMFDMIGLTAPVLFLYAYAMVSTGRWTSQKPMFHVLNLLGAITMLISLSHDWNLPTALLEVCWGMISVVGIVKALRVQHKAPTQP